MQKILVLPRARFDGLDGFMPGAEARRLVEAAADELAWLPRAEAEASEQWVQPIPCVIFRDGSGRYCVFRQARQRRSDLSQRVSFIVGGHIDSGEDVKPLSQLFEATARREVFEETGIELDSRLHPIGLVIDSSSITASRHIGIVYEAVVDASVKSVAAGEFAVGSKYNGQFFNLESLARFRSEFDPWSFILFSQYLGGGLTTDLGRQATLTLAWNDRGSQREQGAKMPLDNLVGVIETLKGRIGDYGQQLQANETRTRMALIDPLLTALGWDVTNPAQVTPEFDVAGRPANYALLNAHRRPAVTIEARKLGEPLDSHRLEMLRCSNELGVPLAGITDGSRWELYDVFKQGGLTDRRLLELSIAAAPAYHSSMQLLRLWRPNIASEQPIDADGHRLLEEPAAESPPTISLESYNPAPRTKAPTAMRFPDGVRQPIRHYWHMLAAAAQWLWETERLTTAHLPFGYVGKRTCLLNTEPVHKSGRPFKVSLQVAGTPMVLEREPAGTRFAGDTKFLLRHFGIPLGSVRLEME